MAKRATERLIADRYTLQRTLGRGGMGVVWRARDTLLGRDVAIKEVQLPPSLNAEDREATRARVLREARAAARLNHPNAVTLYDVVPEEGRTFIVMELVEAPTLAAAVRQRGPLPPEEVAAIGLQVLDALRAAHRVGIVHRDVKPGNVMVPPDGGRAKLADFGIASLAGDPQLTSTGLVLGSPAYMAPEQANGELSGPPVDLWALGATMYYALEGEPPFERGAAVATLTAVVNDPPRPMRRGGPLEPLVLGLLAKVPAERPSAGQLRPQLERVAGRGARRVTPTAVLPPPVEERHPTEPLPAVPAPPPSAAEAPTTPVPAEAEEREPATEAAEGEAPAAQAPAEAEAPAAHAPAEAGEQPAEAGEQPPQAGEQPPQAGAPAAAGVEEPPATEATQAEAPAEPAPAKVQQRPVEEAAAPPPTPGPAEWPPRQSPERGPAAAPAARQGPPLPLPVPVARRRSRAPLLISLLALALVGGLLAAVLLATLQREGDRGQNGPGASKGRGGPSATTAPHASGQPGTTAPGGAEQPGVPAGFRSYSNPQRGYAVAYPSGWKVDEKRSRFNTTEFSDRGSGRSFVILSSKPPTPDLAAASDRWERTVSGRKGFQLIRQDKATYHGRPAVVTEYTFEARGERVHERHVNVDFGTWGYAVVATARDGDWAAADRDVWSVVERTLHTP